MEGNALAYCISGNFPGHRDIEGRLLFRIFRKHLPDNYTVFYQPNIAGYQPDFLLIGPSLGYIVIEIEHLTSLTHSIRSTQVAQRLNLFPSLLRAQNFANQIARILQDPDIPFGYAIVLPQIYQHDLQQKGYLHHSPHILTRDDIDPFHINEQQLINRLSKLIVRVAPFPEDKEQDLLTQIMNSLLPSKKNPLSFKYR
jgi:hypothetical protein